MQARIFFEGFFEPYVIGVCKVWGVSPEEGLQILIDDGSPLGKIAKDKPEDLEALKNEPGVKEMFTVAKHLGEVSDDWIKEKMIVLLEVMREIRPSLANAIISKPGGQKWFYDSLIGLRDIIYGEPEINIENF